MTINKTWISDEHGNRCSVDAPQGLIHKTRVCLLLGGQPVLRVERVTRPVIAAPGRIGGVA